MEDCVMSEPIKIVIVMEGGLIHGVHPLGTIPIAVLVIDYDTEGADKADLEMIPQGGLASAAEAYVRIEGGEPLDPAILAWATQRMEA
jgi:hypothetical protein